MGLSARLMVLVEARMLIPVLEPISGRAAHRIISYALLHSHCQTPVESIAQRSSRGFSKNVAEANLQLCLSSHPNANV